MLASKKLGREDALQLARTAQHLIAAKGKKVTRFAIKQTSPSDDELAAVMLGPTGNMRAPTLRIGNTVVVGYHEQAFAEVFG